MVSKLKAILAILAAAVSIGAWPSSGRYPPTAYVGPGDLVVNSAAWYGLRAYSNAIASPGTNAIINVRRASDNTTKDIVALKTGALDLLTANSFAGVDATCTGTAAGSTTLNLTACSSTPNAGDTLTSSGGTGSFTQPAYIASCGSFTGGAGSCTLNTAQTVTGVTVKAQVALFVTQLYDQTGHGVHQPQTTTANQAQLLPSCFNGLPCLNFTGNQYYINSTTCALIISPFIIAGVYERTANFTTRQDVYIPCSTFGSSFGSENLANKLFINSANGTFQDATATDSVPHSIAVYVPGANPTARGIASNATFYVDNVTTTVSADQLDNTFANSTIGGPNNKPSGYFFQIGSWFGVLTPADAQNLCANDNAFWFFGSQSCAPTGTVFSAIQGPCDLVVCAEGYSLTRAIENSYHGPLFELWNPASTPANFLEVGQNPSTRKADMTTWSAFCGGVATNCVITKIYSQVNSRQNDLFTSNCTSLSSGSCPPFNIEGATGLPILITNSANPGGGQYLVRNAKGNSPAAVGYIGGNHDETVAMNGTFPTAPATGYCCGNFGGADSTGSPIGGDFLVTAGYGPTLCSGSTTYCFAIEIERDACSSCNGWLAPTTVVGAPISFVHFADYSNANNSADMYYNGHTAATNIPMISTPNVVTLSVGINGVPPPTIHLAGGGDLSIPAPIIFREGYITNTVMSASDRANILNNNTAFYTGISFP